MKILVSGYNIQIENSFKVSKSDFEPIINQIKNDLPDHPVSKNRSLKSIKKEWAVHNLLYKLGIARTRTKDLDINYPLKSWESFVYFVFGPCCHWIID